MMNTSKKEVGMLVEGKIDQAAVEKIFNCMGLVVATARGLEGKPYIEKNLRKFNQEVTITRIPLLTLVDLDKEKCAPALRKRLLPNPARQMVFRVAVREIEAWFMADRGGLSRFFQIDQELIPSEPEKLHDPKGKLIELAKESRSAALIRDIVPRGTGAKVGRGYVKRMLMFCEQYWRPNVAAKNSDSLSRALKALETIVV